MLNLRRGLLFFFLISFFVDLCGMCIVFADESSDQMLKRMEQTIVSPVDKAEVAAMFGKVNLNDCSKNSRIEDWQPGVMRNFWVINMDDSHSNQIRAQVVYAGEHVVFWMDEAAASQPRNFFSDEAVKFDLQLYQMMHRTFGSELNPGVDGDPRIHVLITDKAGDSILGYFSSRDEEDPCLNSYSNGMELFILHSRVLGREGQMLDTLTHEMQHMIHFAHDQNELEGIDEGLSSLAEWISDTRLDQFFEKSYFQMPDTSLINWPVSDSTYPHYGGGYLFMRYLYHWGGDELIRAIIEEGQNGLDGIDLALQKTQSEKNADDLFAEWVIANQLYLIDAEKNEFAYADDLPVHEGTSPVRDLPCEDGTYTYDVSQYGVDYYAMRCSQGSYEVQFVGASEVPLLDWEVSQDRLPWWSNRMSNSQTSLQLLLDLSGAEKSASLDFDLLYDIEASFDYLYLLLSADGGNSWQNLQSVYGSDNNDSGFNLGWGYSGVSDDWVHERLDLSAYLGKEVILRFEYLTDQAVVSKGALIDAVSLTIDGMKEAISTSDKRWSSDGFILFHNALPQSFLSSLVTQSWVNLKHQTNPAQIFWLDSGESQTYPCNFNSETVGYYFAISATDRYAMAPGSYTLTIRRME